MVTGFILPKMATSGVHISNIPTHSALIHLVATGLTLNMAGPGFRTTTGDGLHFTTAAGITMLILDGFGYQVTNGLLPGLAGVITTITTAGHHWDQTYM